MLVYGCHIKQRRQEKSKRLFRKVGYQGWFFGLCIFCLLATCARPGRNTLKQALLWMMSRACGSQPKTHGRKTDMPCNHIIHHRNELTTPKPPKNMEHSLSKPTEPFSPPKSPSAPPRFASPLPALTWRWSRCCLRPKQRSAAGCSWLLEAALLLEGAGMKDGRLKREKKRNDSNYRWIDGFEWSLKPDVSQNSS